MAYDQSLLSSIKSIPPAQLWTGYAEGLEVTTIEYLQTLFCAQNTEQKACGHCSECIKIKNKQHSSCLWLKSSQGYTLEFIDPIKETTQFMLSSDELFFIIIPDAQTLFLAAANALLKTIEEPKRGYHFILHAPHTDSVIPTIVSRCIIFQLETPETIPHHQNLFHHFTFKKVLSAPQFFKELEISAINEQESTILLGHITKSLLKDLNNTISEKQKFVIETRLNQLLKYSIYLPKSGSAKLFWRNIFLQTFLTQ
jgi:DNA polymerase III delta prime subunit